MLSLIDAFCALLRRRSATPAVVWFFAGIFLASQLSIAVVVAPIGSATVLALQTTLSPETFTALADDLFRRGLVENYLAHYYYDFLHPLWYATLLALLLAIGMDRRGLPAAAGTNRWLLVPYLAGLLDLLENSCHLYMLLDTTHISPGLVYLGNGAALAKWALVLACSTAFLVLVLGRRRPAA